MYIYNVTTKVSSSIHTDWLHWMKNEHIPAVMQTGCFTSHKMVRILEIDEEEGPTYAVQYELNTQTDYEQYINEFAPILRNDTIQQWGDKIMAFRTIMQVVN